MNLGAYLFVCGCYLHPNRKAIDSGRHEVSEGGSSCRRRIHLKCDLGVFTELCMCRDGLEDGGYGGGSGQAGGSSAKKHRVDPNVEHAHF